MKTKLIKRVSDLAAILAFLAFLAGNAFAADIRGDVPNAETVVSPYWQSDTGSYTFIAVTHTSLSGMASQIGVKINAITNDKSAFGDAVEFTIQSGTTTRVFIARTTHPSINPTAIPTAKFIQGTSDFEHGHIRVDPIATIPTASVTGNFYGKFSSCTVPGSCMNLGNNTRNGGGFRDTTMLSYWGAVVIEQNTTGFAMEFIGDMNDSQSPSNIMRGAANAPNNAFDASIPPSGPNAP
jgi:hypothetical protein